MKTHEQNRNNKRTEIERFDWFSNGYKRSWVLVGYANALLKKLHAWELSRNQSILRFDVILQHDWPIEQCLLHIRVFFGGKTKSPCFDLFIHWLIKQITNTYRNHFSRSYANSPKFRVNRAKITNSFVWTSSRSNFSACRKFVRSCCVELTLVIWPCPAGLVH